MPYSIMLDAGHGGTDPGATYQGRQEKDDALRLVLALGEILQNNGIEVEYTRTTDVYESPFQKATEANQAGVDFFISIHRNSFPQDNVVSGVETLVYDLSGIKLEMAEEINEQLETLGFVNLGVRARPNLVVLKRTQMPALLVEVGFINSDTDNMLFDENIDEIAQAIARGILDTLDIDNDDDDDDDWNMPPRPQPPRPEMRRYTVQTGLFRNRMYANNLRDELREMDFPAQIDQSRGFWRVKVGDFDELEDAIRMEQRLKRAGYQTIIVT